VLEVVDDRIQRVEIFPLEDPERALARLAALAR
jgi:hypothetical protein